jgi:hypothetical protein
MLKIDNFIRKHPVWFLFAASFLMMFIICIPDIIDNGGYFYYYGDYNAQEIPFYMHVHDAIRNGNTAWDYTTGLGSDFIGMYSYYCLTSPFFWLTIPFSTSTVPFLMPYLLSLKIAFSAVFAYLYIKRFVKSQNAALIGSLLYAFSSFQVNNIFYPDFTEVFTFFPLLLIAMEELIQNNRKGCFAITVAFSAVLNYYFFMGQVVFCVIYFLIRSDFFTAVSNLLRRFSAWIFRNHYIKKPLNNKDFPVTPKKFFAVAVESIAGFLMSACILFPTYIHLSDSTRLDEHIYGEDWIIYSQNNVFFEIIRTLFMMPDMPASSLLFYGSQRWSSTAVFLPLFGIIGVIAFVKNHKSQWMSKLAITSLVFALVPILNNAFYLFNGNSHYARWFYMPILILCVMTAFSVQELREEYYSIGFKDKAQNEDSVMMGVFPEPVKESFKLGFKITSIVLIIFAAIALIPVKSDDGEVTWFDFAHGSGIFWFLLLFVVLSYFALKFFILNKKKTGRTLLALVTIACVATTSINFYSEYLAWAPNYADTSVRGEITLPDEGYYRTDTEHDYKNHHLYWGKSGINLFHTTENVTEAEFYNHFGLNDSVQHFSPSPKFYALRGLLSVKYFLQDMEERKREDISLNISEEIAGFEYIETQSNFDIYENKNYVPIGFAYDYYITQDTIDDYKDEHKNDKRSARYKDIKEQMNVTTVNALMSALLLTDEQVEKYGDIISPMPDYLYKNEEELYVSNCDERRSMSCYSFEYDTNGFTAKINLDKSRLVFFSIPYSEGWTATVNGKPADIEKVDAGLMAVKVTEGDTVIRFRYKTPGLEDGILISVVGLFLFVIIIFPSLKRRVSSLRQVKDKIKDNVVNKGD